jgi:hypothetical protein
MPKSLKDILHELGSHIGRPGIHEDIDNLDKEPVKPGFHYQSVADKEAGKEDTNASE